MIVQDLRQALEALKNRGVRMTPQRHAILAYLFQTNCHPSADDIYKALESNYPNMSVATVYNNLKVFKEADLIYELTFGDNSSRFEVNKSIHYHVVCKKCGQIEDLIYPCVTDIEKLAEEKTGFKVSGHHVEVSGICMNCQGLEEDEKKLDYAHIEL